MTVTTSFHMGTTVSFRHNARDPELCKNEKHIDMKGEHSAGGVGVKGVSLRDCYEDIFGEAVREYNERQKRADRKIDSYYDKIAKEERSGKKGSKHLVYEAIMTVGSHKNYNDCFTDDEQIDPQEAKQMLFEAVNKIESRYGEHICIVGVYWHNDESRTETVNGESVEIKSAPHIHVDYVPVATDYKIGMSIQNGQSKAYQQLGFSSGTHKETPQIQFNHACRNILDEVVIEHGYAVSHPIAEKREEARKHDTKQEYVRKALEQQNTRQLEENRRLEQANSELDRDYKSRERRLSNLKQSIEHADEQKREALEERDSARAERDEAETIGRVMDSVRNADKNEALKALETAESYEMRSGALGRTRTDMVRMTPEAYETVKENIKALSDGTALYEAISDAREGIRQYSEEANINRLKAIDTEVEKRTERYRSERDEARASERTVREENTTLREEIASVRENAKAISGTFEGYRRKNDILEHKLERVKDILNRTKQERDDLSDALDKKDDSIREWFFQSLQRIVPERFQKIKESIDWDWDKTSRFNAFEYFYRKGVEEDMKEYGAVMNDTEKYGKEADKVAREYVRDYRKHGIREIYGKIEAWCHERGIRIPTRNHQKQRSNEWER